jgi:hypothetical protein
MSVENIVFDPPTRTKTMRTIQPSPAMVPPMNNETESEDPIETPPAIHTSWPEHWRPGAAARLRRAGTFYD